MNSKKDYYTGAYLSSLDNGLLDFPENFIEVYNIRSPVKNFSFEGFLSNELGEECLELYDLRAINMLEYAHMVKEYCGKVTLTDDKKIVIPQKAISKLNLDKEALILGHNSFIELWKPNEYFEFIERSNNEEKDDFEDILYNLAF